MTAHAEPRPQARTTARFRLDPIAVFAVPAGAFVLFVLLPLAALVERAARAGTLADDLAKPIVREALWLSLATSTLTLLIVLVVGTPLAYVLARWRFPGKRVVDILVDLPLVLPPVVAGVALLMAFGRRGTLGPELEALGVELAFTTWAVIVAQVFVSAPFYIRAVKAGFQAVDPALERMAFTLGASRLSAFRRVSLPLALPAVVGGAVLCWARALSEFGATMMFAGNLRGSTQTLPLAILSAMESDLSAAITIAVILLAVAALVLAAVHLAGRGRGAW